MNQARDSAVMLECAAFMLIRDGELLVERRSLSKALAPGVVDIPGGHLETGESPEEGLCRELREELGVEAQDVRYVCSLVYTSSSEPRRIHYFAVSRWSGEIQNNEAESLFWLPLSEGDVLDLEVDRLSVREYLRLYGGEA